MSEALLKRQAPLIGRYWLVVSLLLVLLPHLTRLPLWLAGASLVVIIWRLLTDHYDGPIPGKALRFFLTFVGIGSVLLVFHTILGREAGSALLSVLICLKLFELRTLRDALLVVFLGYFLVVADFLFDDSIYTGIYMFTVVLFLSTSLIALNHPAATVANTPDYIKRATALLIQAIPLMVLLFILFPRISSPLWRIPEPIPQARTGLSDEMRPGDITDLAESDELVFRVEFNGPIPSADQLYWRGPVLWHTDGRRWGKLSPQQLMHISANELHFAPLANPVRYTVMLEPQQGQWLFALDLPTMLPELDAGVILLPDFELLSNRKLSERVRYTMTSVTAYHTGDLTRWEREYALNLPDLTNPRTRQLAQSWRAETTEDIKLVERALTYFRDQPFFYTRHPPTLGADPVDEFLFSTHQGFCEHYASAFVTLMRAAGIPSRVVTGYQGGDLNAVGSFLEVRQNRAHAWAEVWLTGQGWVRVDPTAVIPPERVLESQDLTRFQSTYPYIATTDSPLLRNELLKLQQAWHAMNYVWSVWVVGFNEERQQALLRKWGIEDLGLRLLISILLISLGMAFVGFAYFVLGRQTRTDDPVMRHYRDFCRRLAKAGVKCLAHEGPHQLSVRAVTALPRHAGAIREIINLYVALRYGRADTTQLTSLKRLVKRFRP